MKIFLNKIKPKKLSTKILLGIVVLFSLYTVINKNYDKEIREPFRLAIHKDDGNLKNTYLIAHEFSKYLVDTPWDHAFYPILILPNYISYLGFENSMFTSQDTVYFGILDKNSGILLDISAENRLSISLEDTLDKLSEDIKKAKDIFLRMCPEDELLLQEFDSTMEQSIIEFIKQIEKDPKKNEYYARIKDYGIRISYNKWDNEANILFGKYIPKEGE